MKFALIGHGRMGREIERLATGRGHECVATLCTGDAVIEAVRRGNALAGADVGFEFTQPDAAAGNVAALIDAGVAVICGTTGWEADAALCAKAEAAPAPVLIAPNFSLGMNLFYRMVRDAARLVGSVSANAATYDPFLWEAHHRGKLDAPSGTARRLTEIMREADPHITAVVEGAADGGVPDGALHVASVRAGSIPGTHSVGWDGPFDTITLEHRARSRSVFALGAIHAAEWIIAGSDVSRGILSFDELLDQRIRSGGGDRA